MRLRVLPRSRSDSRGFTLIELCVVIVVLGTLLSMAVVFLSRAKVAANEANAIASLRDITNAQFGYAVECGRGNYATSLVVLGTKPPGVAHAYLNEDLGTLVTVTKAGYMMTVRKGLGGEQGPRDCLGFDTQTKYYAIAMPEQPGKTGNRAFASNQGGGIWQVYGGTPPAEPFGPPSEPAK